MDAPETAVPGRQRRRRESSPAQRALGLLVRREHSRQELARKLVARGIAAEDAAAAVARMTAEGWQDDARFAASLARTRAGGGYGTLRIRAELKAHALDDETIERALAALADTGQEDWIGHARKLLRRRYATAALDDLAARRKAAGFLLRRGFDSDTVRMALQPDPDG